MRKNSLFLLAVMALLLAGTLVGTVSMEPSAAAPMPAPTPVSVSDSGAQPQVVELLASRSTVDDITGPCVAVAEFNKADIYYSVTIDGSNVNTTTLTLQFGNSPTALTDGVSIASSVAVSTTAMQQVQLFGSFLCLKVDATDASTGTVTVYADALLK